MYYFVVVSSILLSVMSTVNVACSNQTHFVYVWEKRYIYLYTLVYVTKFVLKFNGIKFVCCRYISQLPFSAYSSKGIQFTKVNRRPSESLLYKTCNYLF